MGAAIVMATSCEDEISQIGDSITKNEVTINVDSVKYDLGAVTIEAPSFESKSTYTLLGSVSVPEYGDLACSYVTQFLPAQTLNIPDTITYENVDSVKMLLSIPKSLITGDSLALQKLNVYSLDKQLPSDISSTFDPTGYYDPSKVLGSKSYNLQGETYADSIFTATNNVQVKVKLPKQMGVDIFKAYKDDPDLFVWPQNLAQKWPGIYVESAFGHGCIAAIYSTSVFVYFPQTKVTSTTDSDGIVNVTRTQIADSICVFRTAPEVLSSVNIDYKPASTLLALAKNGNSIITTPGGYAVNFTFPAKKILQEYWAKEYDLGVINNLIFSIPGKEIYNRYGIGVPPAMLLIKTSELDSFFENGKVPDNLNSFYSLYDAESKSYKFSSMRDYIVKLRAKGEENITEEDTAFTLIPVDISTETYQDSYTGEMVTVVTSVLPYILKPTMVELETSAATVVFTYSNQILN